MNIHQDEVLTLFSDLFRVPAASTCQFDDIAQIRHLIEQASKISGRVPKKVRPLFCIISMATLSMRVPPDLLIVQFPWTGYSRPQIQRSSNFSVFR